MHPFPDDVAPMSQHAWTFLSNHAHVLICISDEPTLRLRDIAVRVGITERAVSRIVSDLADDGYVNVTREGRRNHYGVRRDLPLRHPVEAHRTVGDLLALGESASEAEAEADDAAAR